MATFLSADVNKRIAALESIVMDLQEELEDTSNDNKEFEAKFNGYINSQYTSFSGEKNEAKEDGFRLHRLAFIPHQQINSKLRWLGEIEFEDAPRIEGDDNTSTGKLFVERIYIQYDINSQLKVRVGRDFTHSTIYSDNHYPSFVLNQLRPLLERKMFPQITDGIELMGNFNMEETSMDYVAYYGNGNEAQAHNDVNPQDLYGIRIRVSLPYFRLTRFSFALADGYTSDQKVSGDYEKVSLAMGLEEKINDFSFIAQYAYSEITEEKKIKRDGFYLRASHKIGNFTPWLFYEEYDDSSIDNIAVVKRASVGIEYKVNERFKVKLEQYRTLDAKDIQSIASVALYF